MPEGAPIGYAGPMSARRDDLPTVCVLCSHNCGLRVDVEHDHIVAVRADTKNPITTGYVCNKAFSIDHYVHHAQRVRHPLKRQPDGSFSRVSWAEAIGEIGARLRAILARHPPRALALTGVGGQGNHLDGVYALSFLRGLGSRAWFNALAQEKTQHALVDRWMFAAPPTAFFHPDSEHARYLLMIGTNPAVSHRGHNATELLSALRTDASRTLVVVDPRRTETARRADVHLQLAPATDAWLLLGLCAVIVREGLCDRDFLSRFGRDFERIAAVLSAIEPAAMAARAGVPPGELERVARGFAAADGAAVLMDLGAEQVPFSTLIAYLVRLLVTLTGNLGRKGGNVFLGTFAPGGRGLDRTPFRALTSGIEAIEMLAPFGMFSPNLLPEEILSTHPERIRALLCEGANPLVQSADLPRQREAMAALELLVVIDPAMTETARAAHFVLPTPVGYEKWEYSGFPKGYPGIYAQVRPPIVPAPEDALPEAEIYARLARATGLCEPAPRLLHVLAKRAHTPLGAGAYFAALAGLSAARGRERGAAFARAVFWSYEALGPRLAAPALTSQWIASYLFAATRRPDVVRALPEAARKGRLALGQHLYELQLAHPGGVEVARLDPERNLEAHLGTPDRRVHLAPEPMLAEIARALRTPPRRDPDYPLVLNGGRRTHWNCNTIQRDPGWRKGKGPHCALAMSPDDAARLGLLAGQAVRLETRRGAVTLPLELDAGQRPGHVAVPNGFGLEYPDADGALRRTGVAVNELTDAADRDPFTGCPHHKAVPCRVVAGA